MLTENILTATLYHNIRQNACSSYRWAVSCILVCRVSFSSIFNTVSLQNEFNEWITGIPIDISMSVVVFDCPLKVGEKLGAIFTICNHFGYSMARLSQSMQFVQIDEQSPHVQRSLVRQCLRTNDYCALPLYGYYWDLSRKNYWQLPSKILIGCVQIWPTSKPHRTVKLCPA